jgi:drug/metabolite transporter (DMT)-like permease
VTAVVLALCSAALWGTGDFLGGLSTRTLNVLVVLFWSQLVGLLGVAVWIGLSGAERPGAVLLWAVAAGLSAAVGLGCLYRGMAVGAMGIVAPISATSPIVPLAVSVVGGDAPTALQWVGIALALVGIVLVSREPGGAGPRVAEGVGLALVASLGFGLFLVGMGEAAQASTPWAITTARFSSVVALLIVLAATRTVPRVRRGLIVPVIAVGIFDTGANVLFAFATTHGSLGVVSVLSSLYPLATILLARAVLHERLGAGRTAGGLIALGGAALIAAG